MTAPLTPEDQLRQHLSEVHKVYMSRPADKNPPLKVMRENKGIPEVHIWDDSIPTGKRRLNMVREAPHQFYWSRGISFLGLHWDDVVTIADLKAEEVEALNRYLSALLIVMDIEAEKRQLQD
jgi:hypothetical protein